MILDVTMQMPIAIPYFFEARLIAVVLAPSIALCVISSLQDPPIVLFLYLNTI